MALTQTPPNGETELGVGIESDVPATATKHVRSGPCELAVMYGSMPSSVGSVKLYDHDGTANPTAAFAVGTTVPDHVIPFASGTPGVVVFNPPLKFKYGLTYAAATEDGTTCTTATTGTCPLGFIWSNV